MTRLYEQVENWLEAHTGVLGIAVVLCGLVWRLRRAASFYLNPDEVWSYLVASQQDWHGLWGFYQNAVSVAHPPLFILVLRAVLPFSHSEIALRLVPVLAGAFFPWFVMLWVRRMAGGAAGLCALLLLTFSPSLAALSAEVRTYTLALFFLAASLVTLQQALDRASVLWMVWFHLSLYLAILTDYCVTWFVAGLGVYALLWLWRRPAPNNLRIVWAVGQAGAVALYVFLYVTAIAPFRVDQFHEDIVAGWLKWAFLRPGDNPAIFAITGFLRQFSYLMGTGYLAIPAAAVFLLGVFIFWRGPIPVVLLILPFCLACLGGIFHLFPFGMSRHTAFLGILIAAGVAQGVVAMTGRKILPILAAAALLVPVWITRAAGDTTAMPDSRYQLQSMRDAVQFLRTAAPPGSVVVTDTGTDFMLAYYLGSTDYGTKDGDPYRLRQAGGLRVISARTFQFRDDAELHASVAEIRRLYRLDGPVWVAVGGFVPNVTTPASEVRSFSETISIFRSPAPAERSAGLGFGAALP